MSTMNARLNVIRTPGHLIGFLGAIILPAMAFWSLSLDELANHWFRGGLCGFGFLLITQVREDNRHAAISGALTRDVLLKAFILWLPVFVLLLPGLILAYTCDIAVTNTVEYIEFTTLKLHKMTTDEVSASLNSIAQQKYCRWWPPDWFRQLFNGWRSDVLRSSQGQLADSGLLLHSFFTAVYGVLQTIQAISIGMITAIIGRSYIHILFRVWLRNGTGSINFSLATCSNSPTRY